MLLTCNLDAMTLVTKLEKTAILIDIIRFTIKRKACILLKMFENRY